MPFEFARYRPTPVIKRTSITAVSTWTPLCGFVDSQVCDAVGFGTSVLLSVAKDGRRSNYLLPQVKTTPPVNSAQEFARLKKLGIVRPRTLKRRPTGPTTR
jgi:hypothetical protein